MKTILSALIALSVLAGGAGPASALEAKRFWDEHTTSGERGSGKCCPDARSALRRFS